MHTDVIIGRTFQIGRLNLLHIYQMLVATMTCLHHFPVEAELHGLTLHPLEINFLHCVGSVNTILILRHLFFMQSFAILSYYMITCYTFLYFEAKYHTKKSKRNL